MRRHNNFFGENTARTNENVFNRNVYRRKTKRSKKGIYSPPNCKSFKPVFFPPPTLPDKEVNEQTIASPGEDSLLDKNNRPEAKEKMKSKSENKKKQVSLLHNFPGMIRGGSPFRVKPPANFAELYSLLDKDQETSSDSEDHIRNNTDGNNESDFQNKIDSMNPSNMENNNSLADEFYDMLNEPSSPSDNEIFSDGDSPYMDGTVSPIGSEPANEKQLVEMDSAGNSEEFPFKNEAFNNEFFFNELSDGIERNSETHESSSDENPFREARDFFDESSQDDVETHRQRGDSLQKQFEDELVTSDHDDEEDDEEYTESSIIESKSGTKQDIIVKLPVLVTSVNFDIDISHSFDFVCPITNVTKIDWSIKSLDMHTLLPTNTVFFTGTLMTDIEYVDEKTNSIRTFKLPIAWDKVVNVDWLTHPDVGKTDNAEYSFTSPHQTESTHYTFSETFSDPIKEQLRSIHFVWYSDLNPREDTKELFIEGCARLAIDLFQEQRVQITNHM